MPFLLLDAAVLLVLVLFLWQGARRGFILTFFGLVALLVAFVGANFLADALAPKVGEALEPKLAVIIEERLTEQFEAADAPILPDGESSDHPLTGVLGLLQSMGLYEELTDAVENAVRAGMTEVAAAAAAAVAASIAQSLARSVLFFLFFILILVGWTLLSHALNLVSRLPGLNSLNRTAGGLVGVVKGCLILFMAAWALRLTGLISPETAEQTTLLHFFMTNSPISLLVGLT